MKSEFAKYTFDHGFKRLMCRLVEKEDFGVEVPKSTFKSIFEA